MLNPKFVRNNPELVKTKLQTRKVDPAEVDEYLQLDQQNRDAITKVEGLKKQKNQLTEQIGQSDPQSEAGQALIQQVKQLNGDIKSTEAAQTEVNDRLHYLAIRFRIYLPMMYQSVLTKIATLRCVSTAIFQRLILNLRRTGNWAKA